MVRCPGTRRGCDWLRFSRRPCRRRMLRTVLGRTRSRIGERCPSAVSAAAIAVSLWPSRASSRMRASSSACRDSAASEPTATGMSSALASPPRQTMRMRMVSGALRWITSLSIRQRSSAFLRAVVRAEPCHSSGRRRLASVNAARSPSSIGMEASPIPARAVSSAASAWRRSRSVSSQRRSNSAATRRLSGSTWSYCRSANAAR